jgi:hypothetical protein
LARNVTASPTIDGFKDDVSVVVLATWAPAALCNAASRAPAINQMRPIHLAMSSNGRPPFPGNPGSETLNILTDFATAVAKASRGGAPYPVDLVVRGSVPARHGASRDHRTGVKIEARPVDRTSGAERPNSYCVAERAGAILELHVPIGAPLPLPAIVAVKVTAWPNWLGLSEERIGVVDADDAARRGSGGGRPHNSGAPGRPATRRRVE